MKRKILRKMMPALLVILILIPTMAGMIPTQVQAQEYPREQTLILYMHDRNPNPEQMNMYLPGNAYGWLSNVGCNNQLWFFNADNGSIDMWLATGYEYGPNYKSLTISLRKGVTWSDGEPFSADDVIFTFNMLMKHPTLYYATTLLEWVTNIEKIDDYTVRLDLKKPNPRFHLSLSTVWGISIVPKHIWEDEDPLEFTNWPPVHTGPYKVVKADVEEMVFERIDDWWGNNVFGKPEPKYIIWRYLSPEVRVIEMINHNLDACYLAGPTDYLTVKKYNPYAMAWYDGPPYAWIDPCPRYFGVNMRIYPWNITEVRRALSLAINRTKCVEVAYEGYGFVNPLAVPLYAYHQPYFDAVEDILDEIKPTKYDPEEAKAILDRLGFVDKDGDGIRETPDGKPLSMTIISGSWVPEKLRLGEIYKESLLAIGIDAVTKPLEGAAFSDPWNFKTFEGQTQWMCQSWTDPFYMFQKYHSKFYVPMGNSTYGTSNDAGYVNPEFDAIVDKLSVLPYDMNNATIRELYRKATRMLLEDVVFIPTTQAMFTLAQDTYYWEGWANSENPYQATAEWWPSFFWNILRLHSTGRKPPGAAPTPEVVEKEVEVVPSWVYPTVAVSVIVAVVAIAVAVYKRR